MPLDNNASEREMKRICLNRKNSLFVGNERGGRTAAILSSLTSTSLGRLTLNILLSFAQFERELIGERTRDKMSAARRRIAERSVCGVAAQAGCAAAAT